MRKLTVAMALCLALAASAAAVPTPWNLGLPDNMEVNFNGDGVFHQTLPPQHDANGYPLPLLTGMELFGVANITAIDEVGPGTILWTPPAGMEMTLSFWDAVVSSSVIAYDDPNLRIISSTYNDGARLVLVQDDSVDYNSTGGPGPFDTNTGDYPTVYTLPPGGAAADADELVFLDLLLDMNTSSLTWSKVGGAPGQFISATFDSLSVTILGGVGASQFQQVIKGHGTVFTLNLTPGSWLYNADVDVIALTIPAPASLISVLTGLVCLGGYGIRRWRA